MTVFNEVIKSKIAKPCGKIKCLIKYTKSTGLIEEHSKHCMQYETAKKMMLQVYGDPHKVIRGNSKKTKQQP